MTVRISSLAHYLGNPVSDMLTEVPFKNWSYEKSYVNDLEKPIIDYVFGRNGLDIVCDEDDRVTTIFLYSDESRYFAEGLQDIPFSATRQQTLERLGRPSKSGEGLSDPILGEYGPCDRFDKSDHSVHIEYRVDADRIRLITLMRADIVPGK